MTHTPFLVTTSQPSDGWILVSNNHDNSLPLTGTVHHVDGCGASNGRNQLLAVTADAAAGLRHCDHCEARLGIRPPVSRPREGTKVEFRLPEDALAGVDRLAAASGQARAAMLRSLIEFALAEWRG